MPLANSWSEFLTLAITAVGALFVWWQLRQVARQERLQLGQLYLQRYWEINDKLLVEPKGSHGHRQQRHRYLILTEDEFDAASKGWLDFEQWRVWHEWVASSQGRSALRDDLAAVAPVEGRFIQVRRCLAGSEGHSWSECRAAD